jgi:hypothetical protein
MWLEPRGLAPFPLSLTQFLSLTLTLSTPHTLYISLYPSSIFHSISSPTYLTFTSLLSLPLSLSSPPLSPSRTLSLSTSLLVLWSHDERSAKLFLLVVERWRPTSRQPPDRVGFPPWCCAPNSRILRLICLEADPRKGVQSDHSSKGKPIRSQLRQTFSTRFSVPSRGQLRFERPTDGASKC